MKWRARARGAIRENTPDFSAMDGTRLEVILRVGILFVFLILGGVAYYFMKPEERVRVGQAFLAFLREAKDAAVRRWSAREDPDAEPLPPLPFVTMAIAVVNLLVFVDMLVGEGAITDEATLVSFGANFGPRTTNGEWWRLVTATFVHSGFLHLFADLCGLLLVGVIVERLVGSFAFAIVYLGSGLFTGLVSVYESPVTPNVGASGAICGIYGLLVATWLWSLIERSPLDIPLRSLKAPATSAGIFLVYSLATHRLGGTVNLAGAAAGFACGIVLAFGSEERKPAVRRVAAVAGATLLLALAFAVPLRGLSDVRPEIARIVALEDRVAGTYKVAVRRFTEGHIAARTLGDFIDGTIGPEFETCRARLKGYEHVPPEHEPLVKAADEYLRLRAESWRVRSAALHKSNMGALQTADRAEWQALEAYEALRQIAPK